MSSSLFQEAARLWKQIPLGLSFKHTDFEAGIHKQLLNIFQVGDFYYYIFNLKELKFDLMSEEVQKVLGYHPEELDLAAFLNKIHPEDHPWFLNFENKVIEFFTDLPIEHIPKYKVRYDYRIKKSDGSYIRILQQVIILDYDNEGRFFRTFGVHTDISHLKVEGRPVLSFIGLDGQPSYIDVTAEKFFKPNSFLSPREREVLSMLANGKSSKEIASELSISIETVSTHRKKLLAKMNALNTAELIKKATQEGWI